MIFYWQFCIATCKYDEQINEFFAQWFELVNGIRRKTEREIARLNRLRKLC